MTKEKIKVKVGLLNTRDKYEETIVQSFSNIEASIVWLKDNKSIIPQKDLGEFYDMDVKEKLQILTYIKHEIAVLCRIAKTVEENLNQEAKND